MKGIVSLRRVMVLMALLLSLLSVTSLSLPTATAAATIANPGFETGTLSGWNVWTNNNSAAVYVQKGGHTGSWELSNWQATAYQASTSQTLTGLASGYYTLTAWEMNGGNQNAEYIYTKNCGGPDHETSLPVGNSWTLVQILGVHVTSGSCTLGLWSDANAGNWVNLDDFQLTKNNIAYNMVRGADASYVTYEEAHGKKYYLNGVQEDALTIMKNEGVNLVRLRLYNDPGNPNYSPSNTMPAYYQGPADILTIARRAVALGLQIELTFHLSDAWTNPGLQSLPHAWTNDSLAQLETDEYNFISSFMSQMKAQGTTPQYVSIGNETDAGMLWPLGSTSNMSNLSQLFNAGYKAVKAVSSSSQVIIHLSDAGNLSKYEWYFDTLLADGTNFDIIGTSAYPYWTQKTISQFTAFCDSVYARYHKPMIYAETGYAWEYNANYLPNNGPEPYPMTAAGQRDYMYDFINSINTITNGANLGVEYWDPIYDQVYNTNFFDGSGNALPILTQAYKNNF